MRKSYPVRKVCLKRKSYPVRKVCLVRKSYFVKKSYLVRKSCPVRKGYLVRSVKEVIKSDGLCCFACGDVYKVIFQLVMFSLFNTYKKWKEWFCLMYRYIDISHQQNGIYDHHQQLICKVKQTVKLKSNLHFNIHHFLRFSKLNSN